MREDTSALTPKVLAEEYLVNKLSTVQIAKKYGIRNSTTVNRLLDKYHIPKRNLHQAQVQAMKSGRSKHPTLGKKLSPTHRAKVSLGLSKTWSLFTPNERRERNAHLIEYINNLSDHERDEVRHKAAIALLKATKNGSKLEKYLRESLTQAGYVVQYHVTTAVREHQLEADIVIQHPPVLIEVDGPTHRYPIHGEERLIKTQAADELKNGLFNEIGYTVIRLYNEKATTIARAVYAFNKVLNMLVEIKEGRETRKIIHLEID